MSIKSFKWSLKKVSSEEVRLLENLFSFLPESSTPLSIEIRKVLMKHLGEKSFYYLDAVHSKPFSLFLNELPEHAVMAIVGLEPINQKAILQIDTNLAFLLIDRLLGGTSTSFVENRVLTETEAGVLQYLIMQILAMVWHTSGKSAAVHFRFERFCFKAEDVTGYGVPKEETAMLVYKVGIGELSGFVKLIFPAQFINKAFAVAPKSHTSLRLAEKIGQYDYIHTTIWAEAGRAAIAPEDLAALEAGDVVLFDESYVILSDGKIGGKVNLRVGSGESGSISADISGEGKVARCMITGA